MEAKVFLQVAIQRSKQRAKCQIIQQLGHPFLYRQQNETSKRLSPYLETKIWDKDELFTIIKYEPYKRNKAVLALLWDLDARPHEVTLLKIKHIRLKEKYGEGEIPHEAKTGCGPLLLTFSIPYVRDWLNEHPFKDWPVLA